MRQVEPSFAQLRLLHTEQLYQAGPAHNVTTGLRIIGPVDVTSLRRALTALAQRHESLRTAFSLNIERPLQLIGDAAEIDFRYTDLRPDPPGQREAIALHLATNVLSKPFDLTRPPLWRVLLVAIDDAESWLVVTFHHIVIDGWGLEVFWRELGCLYGAPHPQALDALEPVSMQPSQYPAWERQLLQGERLERHLRYWRAQLADAPPSLALPADGLRSGADDLRGTRDMFPLGDEFAEQASALAADHKTTLFVALLSTFVTLLYRYSGQEDFVIGTPAANRARPEVGGLIGFVTNALPLRFDLSGNPRVSDLIRQVRQVTLGALAHQELPFELLARELSVQRDLGRQPLFQVMFSLEPGSARQLRLAELEVLPLDLPHTGTSLFDLTLTTGQVAGGLAAMLEYRNDLFDASTVERMAGHFRELMASSAADPDQRIRRLPMITAGERSLLTGRWARGAPGQAPDCLQLKLERQADRTPTATAVRAGTTAVTYAELDAAANRLARALRARGLRAETLLAVCLPRSVELVTVLLAALKAGGAYAALDPTFPAYRLGQMVQTARPAILVSADDLRDEFCDELRRSGQLPAGCELLSLEELLADAAGYPDSRPHYPVSPGNIAYVVHTSGSTGRPMGIMITHRSVCNVLDARHRFVPLRSDVAVLHSPAGGDLLPLELWGALAAGGQVRIAPAGRLAIQDYQELAGQASYLCLTAGLFNLLAEQDVAELAALRLIDLGSEPVSAAHVARIRGGAGTVTLNSYGPAECTTVTTSGTATRVTPLGRVPIGRPVTGAEVYVLDQEMEPVPVGIPGELYIGGLGVARGYLNQPGRTAGRFRPNPFAAESSARLYRTGDIVRWLPDGALDFVGRRDDQVKLRGFRVELGDIEVTLRAHKSVRDAVAAVYQEALQGAPAQRRLVGYVVPASDAEPCDFDQLREFLRSRLPDHMVPNTLVPITEVPLAVSGKVDRSALPAPAQARAPAPAAENNWNATELLLADLWREVLGVAAVGLDDNFFELGGDSLGVMRLAAELKKRGLVMPVQAAYRAQTIRAAARYLNQDPVR
ncbi:MAG TPA: amino acid adenylation domain-containing protein [Streptosporangiaceae bacterium]|nr:amino acid adenylation domain-containing protein [Streptosporangiaceae bacterium]